MTSVFLPVYFSIPLKFFDIPFIIISIFKSVLIFFINSQNYFSQKQFIYQTLYLNLNFTTKNIFKAN